MSRGLLWVYLLLGLGMSTCKAASTAMLPHTSNPAEQTAVYLIPFNSTTRTVIFESKDGTRLVGQFDLRSTLTQPPLAFIICRIFYKSIVLQGFSLKGEML